MELVNRKKPTVALLEYSQCIEPALFLKYDMTPSSK